MITFLELAAVDFLTARLQADTSLAGIAYEVRAATNKAKPPGDRSMIVARCDDAPSQGEGLYLVSFQILVISPADVATVTVEKHAKLEQAVTKAFASSAQSAFNSAIAAKVDGKAGGNFFADGWKPGSEGTNWQPYFSVTAGVKDA